ncbi:signal transduction histidine kinase [Tamilnaduibacter salinus]|uniref:histidine kinase n=1 Tax=Tamilnaduibacter salinus TaxID=1484056 RepID=A0A2A2I2T3_9GAMM|nr:ATP-binding protein [Tamilnaduibacter salinus]PAV25626.1 hybrid sensor histidine kinase/response regulator [Tamilnaduibacter salinus]PVY78113.1 signal transduction histidine kinase [Tamilnaduibacter salinus]
MSKRPPTLNRQLLWLGMVPAVVMFLILLIFFTSARIEDARRDLFSTTQVIADHLAPAVEYSVVSGNRDALQRILERTLTNDRIAWVQVSDNEDRLLGRESKDGRPTTPEGHYLFHADVLQRPLDVGSDGEGPEADWFRTGFASDTGAVRVGQVTVAVSEQILVDQRLEIILTSLVVATSVLLLTLLIIHHVAQRISDPIRTLSQNVRELIQGQYQLRPLERGNSSWEIRELDQNIGALAYHLQQLRDSREKMLDSSEQARERAEQANQAKSQFLAMMSHELRTPLNAVLGMLQLMNEESLSHRQHEQMITAHRATEDLLTLINNILDFSRADRGTLTLSHQTFRLSELVNNCVASHRHECEQKALEIHVEFADDWPNSDQVRGDAARLRQIISSLLDNAIKFTQAGAIRVRCTNHPISDSALALGCSIQDSGDGIPAEQVGQIFNSFAQMDTSGTRPFGGAGIGLALVQRLIELMGGHVEVSSEPGTGSAFYFEVPFERSDGGTEDDRDTTHQPSQQRASNRSLTALVVEDNEVNQRVASALLKKLGFETVSAGDGKRAVSMVTESPHEFSLVLMDCHMPVMDGYEATRYIRAWETAQKRDPLPIIALTADALPGTENACRHAGMNDYLAKPVRKDRLRAMVDRWLVEE